METTRARVRPWRSLDGDIHTDEIETVSSPMAIDILNRLELFSGILCKREPMRRPGLLKGRAGETLLFQDLPRGIILF